MRRARSESIVRLQGDLDLSTLDSATTALASAREGAATLIPDLRDVGFMDTGIAPDDELFVEAPVSPGVGGRP